MTAAKKKNPKKDSTKKETKVKAKGKKTGKGKAAKKAPAKRVAKKAEKSKGRPKMTIKEKLISHLTKQGQFTKLEDIYKILKADSNGKKAGIRGLLNRGCRKGVFQRTEIGNGEYKLA